MILIKILSLVTIFGLSEFALAERWQKVFSCEDGTAYIDVNLDERRNLQLVFKGQDMLMRMKDAGFIWPNFGDQEAILRGIHAELKQVSSTITEPVSLGGVFYSHDFRKMISENGARSIEIEKQGSSLVLKYLEVRSGTSCEGGEFEGECLQPKGHKTYIYHYSYELKNCELK